MNKKHAKSPCCRGEFIRFGSRRRQCVVCRKTWRIRKKKRGRKRLRSSNSLVEQYFAKSIGTLHAYARDCKKSDDALQRRFARNITYYLAHTPWELPPGDEPLIAVADAMWHNSEGINCTAYFILVRQVFSSLAWILPPVIVPGKENGNGWRVAGEEIPAHVKPRIVALVCDGKRELRGIARRNRWRVQLCHYHLISGIKNYATGNPGTKWYERGKVILSNIYTAITTTDDEKLERSLEDLAVIADNIPHKVLARRIRWFLAHRDQFRTYLNQPRLNLPTTTNSVESLNSAVRMLLGRSRGLRSASSFTKWIRAFCLYKKTIVCNGKLPTKLMR